MIRIVVVDDHPLVLEGLSRIIEREPDLELVGRAGSSGELAALLERTPCDVLVLDIGLPDKNGLDVLEELKSHYPQVAVLMLSIYPEERFAVRAFRIGAAGYLTKSAASDELITAIHKVSAGGRYVSGRLAEELARNLSRPGDEAPHTKLSNRENEVFLLLAQGGTTAEIARQLHLSENTIYTYRNRILRKLDRQNNAQLSLYAIRYDLIN